MSDAINQKIALELKKSLGGKFPIMIGYYIEDAEIYCKNIEIGLAEKDNKKVASSAHPLKSSSRQIGAVSLGDMAGYIEEKAIEAGESGDLSFLHEKITSLKEALDKVISELRNI